VWGVGGGWWCGWALAPTHGGAITAITAARARAIPAARRSTSGVRGSSRDRTASNRATRTAARRKATIAGKPALERAQETAGKAPGGNGGGGRSGRNNRPRNAGGDGRAANR